MAGLAAPASALAAHAAATPDAPFLFFRDARGQFVWWSWRRAAEAIEHPGAIADTAAGELAALEFLRGAIALGAAAETAAARELLSAWPARRRQVWLTSGDLEHPTDRVLAIAALAGGWAVVHEPGAAIHPETFAWVRPTVVGGRAADLVALLDAFASLAPRWRRRSWTARRLRRLVALVVEPADGDRALKERIAGLGASARVLSIAPGGW